MPSRTSILALLCCSLWWTPTAQAQTSYPMLMSLRPVAVQVGRTSEHTIKSRYSMFGAYSVLVTGDGVTGEILHPETKDGERPNLQEMRVRFTVSPDALPGVRDFRIGTPQGASTLGQLLVTASPVVVEAGNNNTREQANAIELPATICGAIERAEDVDCFAFHAEGGQALSWHVQAQRLQDRIHDLQQHVDPIISLRDARGNTLASSDNAFFADPFLHFTFEESGEYFLEIRDVRYQGNQYWEYAIESSDRPFVTHVYPPAVSRGQQARFEYVGFRLPADGDAFVSIPYQEPSGSRWWRVPMTAGIGNPAPLTVSDLPVCIERGHENDSPELAQQVRLPIGIAGRIDAEGDIDCYSFAAMKSERFSFEVMARRQQSALDSHLRILDAQGKQLALSDDLRLGIRSFADSWIENWTAPADGVYFLEIRDLHLRGGREYVYFVEASRSQPRFELFVDTDKTQLTPGTSSVIFVRALRKNGFEGEIQLGIEGLPDCIEARRGRILAGQNNDGCIVLTASSDAPLSLCNVTITGHARFADGDRELDLTAQATPYQEIYQPGGGRGHWPVTMHTVAVGELSDLRDVTLSDHEITLRPGESKKIEVQLVRAEGFDKNVTLDVTNNHLTRVYGSSLPPGITLDKTNSKTLFTGSTSSGHITLTAAKDAPAVEQQQICVLANVSLNFVMKACYTSRPLLITIQPPD